MGSDSGPHGDADVVALVVTMAITAERDDEFLELAAQTIKQVHENEPGTMLYAMHRHPTEPHTYVWLERYRDEAAFAAHSAAPYITAAVSRLSDLVAAPPQGLRLEQVLPR